VAALVFALVATYKAEPRKRSRTIVATVFMAGVLLIGWLVMPSALQERISVATVGVRQSFDTRVALARQGLK